MAAWCRLNKLQLNERKCVVISFSKSSAEIQYPYSINGIALKYVSSCRDLGVIFDNRLAFTNHYSAITASALRILGFVIRATKNFRNLEAIKMLYSALVRPKLEYASVIWAPTYKKYAQSIEKIQRRFLKYLIYKRTGIYPACGTEYLDICGSTNMLTLEERRICAGVSFIVGLCRGLIYCPSFLALLPIKCPPRNLRSTHPFQVPLVRSALAQALPLYRLTTLCNLIIANSNNSIDNNSSNDNNDAGIDHIDLFDFNQLPTTGSITSILMYMRNN
ncbi:GSCOCG00011812001-RA-CDS, partial [Cotesia congregata]